MIDSSGIQLGSCFEDLPLAIDHFPQFCFESTYKLKLQIMLRLLARRFKRSSGSRKLLFGQFQRACPRTLGLHVLDRWCQMVGCPLRAATGIARSEFLEILRKLGGVILDISS